MNLSPKETIWEGTRDADLFFENVESVADVIPKIIITLLIRFFKELNIFC